MALMGRGQGEDKTQRGWDANLGLHCEKGLPGLCHSRPRTTLCGALPQHPRPGTVPSPLGTNLSVLLKIQKRDCPGFGPSLRNSWPSRWPHLPQDTWEDKVTPWSSHSNCQMTAGLPQAAWEPEGPMAWLGTGDGSRAPRVPPRTLDLPKEPRCGIAG